MEIIVGLRMRRVHKLFPELPHPHWLQERWTKTTSYYVAAANSAGFWRQNE